MKKKYKKTFLHSISALKLVMENKTTEIYSSLLTGTKIGFHMLFISEVLMYPWKQRIPNHSLPSLLTYVTACLSILIFIHSYDINMAVFIHYSDLNIMQNNGP